MGLFSQPLQSSAHISPCRSYRYTLTRVWDVTLPVCVWIMLNPSTAGARADDATIRKCRGFSTRSTDPRHLRATPFPVSAADDPLMNDRSIQQAVNPTPGSGMRSVVVAWGNHGAYLDRDLEVLSLLDGVSLYHLGLTNSNQPGHPLMISYEVEPMPLPRWRRSRRER